MHQQFELIGDCGGASEREGLRVRYVERKLREILGKTLGEMGFPRGGHGPSQVRTPAPIHSCT